jgi:hypothetical protein
MSERQLATQIRGMTEAAVADQRIGDQDLVPILVFIGSVVLVVEQAFTTVYTQLIELAYARPEDLFEPRKSQILKSLDSVLERSRYRDVEEICSRLHHLEEHYSAVIRPKLGHLEGESEWAEVFALLNQHEGRIMDLVRSRVCDIGASLREAKTSDLGGIREAAGKAVDELRGALANLWRLRNQILGLSGEAGLLELLETGRRPQVIAASE